jgi:hypothetical protein
MVLLAAVGGRPVIGCVCADGSFKTACPMLREALEHRHCASRETTCCNHRDREESAASCCESDSDTAERSLVNTKCCHPVVQAPVLPPLGEVVSVAPDHELAFAALPVELNLPGIRPTCPRVDDDTGLPAPDLVVVLRRLII